MLPLSVWLGESGKYFYFRDKYFQIWVIGCFIISLFIAMRVWPQVVLIVVVLGMSDIGLLIGLNFHSKAFNECVLHGDDVRVLLESYKVRNGHYPTELQEIGATLPCKLFLRGNLLKYSKTASGYEMSFSDYLVTHQATDSQPFMAIK